MLGRFQYIFSPGHKSRRRPRPLRLCPIRAGISVYFQSTHHLNVVPRQLRHRLTTCLSSLSAFPTTASQSISRLPFTSIQSATIDISVCLSSSRKGPRPVFRLPITVSALSANGISQHRRTFVFQQRSKATLCQHGPSFRVNVSGACRCLSEAYDYRI